MLQLRTGSTMPGSITSSPVTVWRDLYPQLAVVATATRRIALGPTCSNPATRHPFVTAQAIATVDEISGGRARLGIGIPVLVIAGGPIGGQCAAEMADGVMFRAGDVAWSEFPARMAQLRAWREQGPRRGDPFEVQMTLPSYITASSGETEQARRLLGPVVAAMAHASMRESWLPPELVEPWKVFQKGYDYTHHVSSANRNNDDLMAELGLADFLFERYSFIGTSDEMVERLFELQDMGVTAIGVGFGHSVDKTEADEQFDRAVATRGKYLKRVGPQAIPDGPLAARTDA